MQLKSIVESNEVIKNDFSIDRSGVSHEKQKEIFNKFVKERALEFAVVKDRIDPNNLIYSYKTKGNIPKDFGYYQIPWKLFEDVRDGDVNSKDVLSN